MDHGLKMLSPLSEIKGQEIISLTLLSFIIVLLCLMFLLADNRGIILIMTIRSLFVYSYTKNCFHLPLYLGITLLLLLKPYLPASPDHP